MPEMKSLTLNDKKYDCFVDSVARTLASATAVIQSASGESVTVSDASDVNLYGLRIFGKTTQDGVPTPDDPVDLVNVGDGGSITVDVTGENDAQSMTVSTPNGLPGIPVAEGGNYTDANGQQWICDEVDFAKGVYIKRVSRLNIDEYSNWYTWGVSANVEGKTGFYHHISSNPTTRVALCNILPYNQYAWGGMGVGVSANPSELNNQYISLAVENSRLADVSTNEAACASLVSFLREISVYMLIAISPAETPLTEEELAAYAELHTYRNHTTVSNDAGAHMELEYVMDAKKYIDSLMGTGGSSARLGSVTLKSSAWKTNADGLHSQVVTIAGVTPYSKVDLLPSVEQLAVFHNKDVAFVTENEDGVVTVFAIGDKPTMDYTMQISITEVTV